MLDGGINMKKFYLGLFFALALAQTTFAIDHTFMFSLRISDGVTNTFGKDASGAMNLSGSSLTIGTDFQFQLSSIYSIILSPEFQFDFLESSESNNGKEEEFEFDLIYLNLPLFSRFNFGRAFAEIGPQANINVFGRAFNDEFDSKNIDFMNEFELALSIGGGYRFRFGLEVDGRFQLGFSNIFNDDTMNDDVKKWTIAVGVSYWFIH